MLIRQFCILHSFPRPPVYLLCMHILIMLMIALLLLLVLLVAFCVACLWTMESHRNKRHSRDNLCLFFSCSLTQPKPFCDVIHTFLFNEILQQQQHRLRTTWKAVEHKHTSEIERGRRIKFHLDRMLNELHCELGHIPSTKRHYNKILKMVYMCIKQIYRFSQWRRQWLTLQNWERFPFLYLETNTNLQENT